MKKLKLVSLSLALFVGSLTYASNAEPDTKSEIRSQIIDLLKKTEITIDSNQLLANVSFTLNEKSELVIISVKSDDKNSLVDNYIKKHLNYKKVKVNQLKVGKVYEMPFKIIK